METTQKTKIVASFKKGALVLSFLAIALGVLTQIGWLFDIIPLRSFSVSASSTAMNPTGAVLFILIGLSIQVIGRTKLNKFIWFAKTVGIIVLLIGFLKLVAIIFHFDANLHLDQVLFSSKIGSNRISPNAALSFVFIGLALLLLAKDKCHKFVQFLCLLATIISLFGVFGYIYNELSLYAIAGLTPLALNSALAFLILSLAIMFIVPDKGFMRVFVQDSPGGKSARILLPAILFIPTILDKILLVAAHSGFVTEGIESPLHSILVTVTFLGIIYWLAIQIDKISHQQKAAQEALKSSELNYRRLFESAQDSILILDADSGKIIDSNPFLEKLLGFSHNEILGKELWEIGVFKDKKASKDSFSQLQTNKYIRYKDLPLQTKDGRSIYVEFVSNVYPVGDQKVIQCNIRDITNQKIADDKLTQEKIKAEAILASIGDGVIVTDKDGRVTLMNKAAWSMLGWHHSEFLGNKLYETFNVVDEKGQSIPYAERPITLALTTGKEVTTTTTKYYYVRKDGEKFPVAITVTPVILDGAIVGAIDIFRDITQEEKLNKAKTEFVSLASHQLRTPLTAIRWNAELLQSNKDLPRDDKEYLQAIYDGTLRMIGLVGSFLNVARLELDTFAAKNEPIDLREVVQVTKTDLGALSASKKIKIAESYDHNLAAYHGDDKIIKIIILNLLSNAIKYSHSGGEVKINIGYRKAGSEVGGRKLNTESLLIKVSDQGIGIPNNQRPKIFTKMFRADNAQAAVPDGSGLGLYLVKQVVEKSRGAVWFTSEGKKDTTFYVTLSASGMISKSGTNRLT